MPQRRNSGAPTEIDRISAMFSSTGDAAGTANLRQVFRMPPASATSDMKPMYGNIQRVMTTAASNPAARWPWPRPAAAHPPRRPRTRSPASRSAAWRRGRSAAGRPPRPASVLRAASTGTKAWLKAPSPNTRRNRLGMRKATLKASVSALTPNTEANSTSRTRPVIREARVSRETVEADLSRDTGAECRARQVPERAVARRIGRNRQPGL
jgi:hypothetical protein